MNVSYIYKTFLFLFLVGGISCSSLPEIYPEDSNLIIEENADYILLKSANTDNNNSGIIFYPGGLVDAHAYIQSLKEFVLADNRTVVIVKVSSNLAILNTQKATSIINKIHDINNWVVGGHSLGGSVTCIDVFNNSTYFDAIFLLAAYSINDLSGIDIPVISITTSEDKVLDKEKFEENKPNLPEGITIASPSDLPNESTAGKTIYYEINGGNHAQFGSYGDQKGDGSASLDANSQQLMVVEMLRKFLFINKL